MKVKKTKKSKKRIIEKKIKIDLSNKVTGRKELYDLLDLLFQ